MKNRATKFCFKRDELLSCVSSAADIATKSAHIPMISNLLIRSGDAAIHLYANSLDTSISCSIPVENSGSVNACVDAKLFKNIVRNSSDTIDVSISGGDISIVSGSARYKISYVDGSMYPKIHSPKEDAAFFVFDRKDFTDAINRVLFCSSNSASRSFSDGVFVSFSDTVEFVACDSRKLAIYSVENKSEYRGNFFIDRNICLKILKVIGGQNNIGMNVETVTKSNKRLFIRFDNIEMYSTLGPGDDYIPYNKILDVDKNQPIVVDRNNLIASIKRLMVMYNAKGDELSSRCTINVKENLINLSTVNKSFGSAKEDIKAECTGDRSTVIDFNYLLTFLTKMNSDKVILCFKDDKSAFYIEEQDCDYRGIIMPIRPEMNQ